MKNPFGIVVAVVFQNTFYLGIHQNNVFFLKKSFLTSVHQNNLKTPKTKLI
jgi:hypothetical protein